MAIDELASKHRIEMEAAKRQGETKQTEIITMLKLESEQKLKQAEISFERAKSDLIAKHRSDLATTESKFAQEYYEKLRDSLEELHTKGNITTKFMQDLTMELLAQSPKLNKTRVKVKTIAAKANE